MFTSMENELKHVNKLTLLLLLYFYKFYAGKVSIVAFMNQQVLPQTIEILVIKI